MPPRRQRLRLRQLIWVFAPLVIIIAGISLSLPAAIVGANTPGSDAVEASLVMIGFFITLWGGVLGVVLFAEGDNFEERLMAARLDRPRLYRRRFRRGRGRRQYGVGVRQQDDGLVFQVFCYTPPSRELIDLIALDFLGPWDRVAVPKTVNLNPLSTEAEVIEAWQEARSLAGNLERQAR